jgi:signal transduction histidine kinase
VTGLLIHAIEVTEQRKAQAAAEAASRRASFLANASQALSASLDYESTLDRLARLVVPDVAGLSTVSVLQADGVLKLVAVVHGDPDVVERVRQLAEGYPATTEATRGMGRVARTGQAEMVSDVSDAVLTESARDPEHARLYREAQEASRLKDEFLATLSHELRTPLNAIVGWAHILRDTGVDASPHKTKAVETIVRNAQVQSQLISDILDVSRIVAGKLANAIKFTPRGGRVQARLEVINSHVEVTVEDNGPGIDPAFLPFIFERFRQADSSSTRRHGGLGLGLAIVRHMVELHGGTVEAANRKDPSGAVFKIRLPRRSVTAEPPRPAERHPTAEGTVWLESAPSLEDLRVLVVDDEADARELIATVIMRCGGEATIAGSAAEAYEALRREHFDVIVADIEMPDEDGYEFMRSVRSLPAEQGALVPAVALTAYASTQDRVKALGAGFQIHVPSRCRPPSWRP